MRGARRTFGGMSNNAATLLWNRRHVTLTSLGDGTTLVDRFLTQPGRAFENSSVGEPPLGIEGVAPPIDGTLPASRIQVIPMAPMLAWADVTHSEPYFDTASGTVKVLFTNGGDGPTTVNVLFWDPHTLLSPGEADTYNPVPIG